MILALAMTALGPSTLCAQDGRAPLRQIRPGDVIDLDIWREPDMSNQYIVNEEGRVVFPLVGEYSIEGETPASLKQKLLADYGQYLRTPAIEVRVLRRVSILGAVNDPGLKLVDPTTTIRDALALAGGATTIGEQGRVRVVRDGQEIAVDVNTDMTLVESIIQSGDQLYVPERSWFSRNSNVVATALSATVALTIALFIR